MLAVQQKISKLNEFKQRDKFSMQVWNDRGSWCTAVQF
jgi:hypothetical protein